MNIGIVLGSCLIIFFIIGLSLKLCRYNILFYLFDFIVGVSVYFIHVPEELNYDMTRYEELLDLIRSYNNLGGVTAGLHWTLNYSTYASQPFDAFYIWLFSLFKNNGYLFAVTTYIFLFLISKLIISVCKDFKIGLKIGLVVQVIVLSIFCLGWEISGLRNNMAFVILVWAIYYDVTDKSKVFSIVFYLLSYLIHPSVIIFIILRVLLIIFNNRLGHIIVILITVVYPIFINNILDIAQKINIFPNLEEKANAYLYGGQNFNQFASGPTLFVIICILITLILEVIFYNLYYRNINLKSYIQIYITYIFFAISSFLSSQLLLRTTLLLLFMSIPIKIILFSNINSTKYNLIDPTVEIVRELYKLFTLFFSIFAFVFWYQQVYVHMLI